MNDLTDVELQTCGARQTEQESKLSAFFAKMEEFFASPSTKLIKIAWYNTSLVVEQKSPAAPRAKGKGLGGVARRTPLLLLSLVALRRSSIWDAASSVLEWTKARRA